MSAIYGARVDLDWDTEDNLTFIDTPSIDVEFEYDDAGARTRRIATDGTKWSYYGNGYQREEYITPWGQLGTKHHFQILAGQRAVAEPTFNEDAGEGGTDPSTIEFSHNDERGSPQVVSRMGIGVVQRMSWDVYGQKRDSQDWTNMMTWSNQSDTTRGFTGHDELEDAGMIWMASRHYDPKIGRFIRPDTIVANPKSTQGWARYVYVENDPVNFTDPTGHARDDGSGRAMAIAAGSTNSDSFAMSQGFGGGADVATPMPDSSMTPGNETQLSAAEKKKDNRPEGAAVTTKDPKKSASDKGKEVTTSKSDGEGSKSEKGAQKKANAGPAKQPKDPNDPFAGAKGVTIQYRLLGVTTLPDETGLGRRDGPIEQRGKDAWTDATPKKDIEASTAVKMPDGEVVVTFAYRIVIQTHYRRGISASGPSAYGRGTTPKDEEDGNTSLGFHERQHAADYRKLWNRLGNFSIRRTGLDLSTVPTAIGVGLGRVQRKIEASSYQTTDCVGDKDKGC